MQNALARYGFGEYQRISLGGLIFDCVDVGIIDNDSIREIKVSYRVVEHAERGMINAELTLSAYGKTQDDAVAKLVETIRNMCKTS